MSEQRDPWLTEGEAAKELRVSPSVVRAERAAGKLGFARLRRRVFYPMSLIDAYKASITCPAKSASGSIPSPSVSTSHGRSGGGRSVFQLASEAARKQKNIGRLSS